MTANIRYHVYPLNGLDFIIAVRTLTRVDYGSGLPRQSRWGCRRMPKEHICEARRDDAGEVRSWLLRFAVAMFVLRIATRKYERSVLHPPADILHVFFNRSISVNAIHERSRMIQYTLSTHVCYDPGLSG
jgi:hypothetical protein